MAAAVFYIEPVREGLELMVDGPVADAAHPLHDPVLWLAETTAWVFDDSGLEEIRNSASANEAFGPHLRRNLDRLDHAVCGAERTLNEDARRRLWTPATSRHLIVERCRASDRSRIVVDRAT